MAEPSIFTSIIRGEIPSQKIYEDDKTIAFLDIHPVQPGHTLVVPKIQIDHLWDLPDEDYQALMATLKRVAQRMREVFPGKRIGVQVVGIDVPHAHIHLIPFNSVDEFRNIPNMGAEPDFKALAEIASKLVI
jgi:histidine triad (HIT) family protein